MKKPYSASLKAFSFCRAQSCRAWRQLECRGDGSDILTYEGSDSGSSGFGQGRRSDAGEVSSRELREETAMGSEKRLARGNRLGSREKETKSVQPAQRRSQWLMRVARVPGRERCEKRSRK